MRPSRTASRPASRQRRHAHVPLLGDQRLDDGATAVAMPHLVRVRLLFHEQAALPQLVDEARPRASITGIPA